MRIDTLRSDARVIVENKEKTSRSMSAFSLKKKLDGTGRGGESERNVISQDFGKWI